MAQDPRCSHELFGARHTVFGDSDTPYAMLGRPPEIMTEVDRYWDRFAATVKALRLSSEIETEASLPPLPDHVELGE